MINPIKKWLIKTVQAEQYLIILFSLNYSLQKFTYAMDYRSLEKDAQAYFKVNFARASANAVLIGADSVCFCDLRYLATSRVDNRSFSFFLRSLNA